MHSLSVYNECGLWFEHHFFYRIELNEADTATSYYGCAYALLRVLKLIHIYSECNGSWDPFSLECDICDRFKSQGGNKIIF